MTRVTQRVATAPVSVVILTFNEERNLADCIKSVADWAASIFVVDSGSTDRTASMAVESEAHVVTHPFETHARQWAWAMAHLPIHTEWVLAIDADQRVTAQLRDEILRVTSAASDTEHYVGYYVNRRQVFRGRWIRHGGYYPKYLLKLFRRGSVSFDDAELVDHHFHVSGRCGRLEGDLIEDNQNEARIFDWVEKHNRYAKLMAAEELHRLASAQPRLRLGGTTDERTAWLKSIWARLPLYWRPFAYFIYRYVFRLGFLDGKEGFLFHFLQACWFRLLVDINREELQRNRRSTQTASQLTEPVVEPAKPGSGR